MAAENSIDEKYRQVGQVISGAGGTPVPVNDTLVKLLRYFIHEDELDFILAFNERKSQTLQQLADSTGLSEAEAKSRAEALAEMAIAVVDLTNTF
ncbi:MAG: hypothetical protein ACOC7W_08585, partial [Desulfosalsimonas sp.]